MNEPEHPADADDRRYHELRDRIAEERMISDQAREYAASGAHLIRGEE